MVRTVCGPLAQLAEQQTLNLRVLGSIPRRLTRFPQEDAKSRLGGAECLRLRRTRHVTGARATNGGAMAPTFTWQRPAARM